LTSLLKTSKRKRVFSRLDKSQQRALMACTTHHANSMHHASKHAMCYREIETGLFSVGRSSFFFSFVSQGMWLVLFLFLEGNWSKDGELG
jgi:hypothetical protein